MSKSKHFSVAGVFLKDLGDTTERWLHNTIGNAHTEAEALYEFMHSNAVQEKMRNGYALEIFNITEFTLKY